MVYFDGEDFIDISGYEGKYAVSKSGRVYSYPNRSHSDGKLLQTTYNRYDNGYLAVGLLLNGVYKKKLVHRLVAETFIDNIPGEEVNHLDGNKSNNDVKNLEWVTHQKNIDHCFETGLRNRFQKKLRTKFVGQDGSSKYCVKAVSIQRVKDAYKITPSCRKLADMFKVSHETIRQALKG